jgi:hypothetical protein
MVCILVDFNNIIKSRNLPKLKKFLEHLPIIDFSIGVVFDIKKETFETLESFENGDEKVYYMDTEDFLEGVVRYSYIVYDKKNKLCEIDLVVGDLIQETLEIALKNLPNDVTIFIFVPLKLVRNYEVVERISQLGFGEPLISSSNPFNLNYSDLIGVYFSKLNFITDSKNIHNDLRYLLSNYISPKTFCELSCVLSPKTIKFFKNLPHIGSTWNKENISQKELGGILIPTTLDENYQLTLDIDDRNLVYGEEEGVTITGGLYNFHTHPREAYERNNVELGWPSAQDYIGYLISFLNYKTLLHIVVSLEGIYVLTLSEFWFKVELSEVNFKDVMKFIAKKFDIKKDEMTIDEYIRYINKIEYEEKQLFNIEYILFENMNRPIEIKYYKFGMNCIFNQTKYLC